MLKGQKKMLVLLVIVLAFTITTLFVLYKKQIGSIKNDTSKVIKANDVLVNEPANDELPNRRYTLKQDQKISWKIFKRTGGTHEGAIEKVNGYIDYSKSIIAGGELEFDMNSITNSDIVDTDLKARFIKDLKGPDFFSVDKFSRAKVIISSVDMVKENDNELLLRGQLTIKNITKPVEVSLRKTEHDNMISIIGTGYFNRIDYGINKGSSSLLDTFGAVLVDDDVQLSFVLNFE